jgi:hypothetical protein
MTQNHKHGSALTLALAAGVLIGAASLPARAAPLDDFDRQASADAQRDVQGALTQLTAHHWPLALNRLERAETALLNREGLDLGAALVGNQPLPKTSAMVEIDAARAALASHDAAQARAKATLAAHDIGTEIGAV